MKHLLVSSIACDPAFGSEGWIAYKYLERLSQHFRVTLIAGHPAEAPAGVRMEIIDIGPFDSNDVGLSKAFEFDSRQDALLRERPELHEQAVAIHRLTPCTLTYPTRLHRWGKPLVIGPSVEVESVPKPFQPCLHREFWRQRGWKRVRNAVARRVLNRRAADLRHVRDAQLVILGNREAARVAQQQGSRHTVRTPHVGLETDHFTPGARADTADGELRLLFAGRAVPYKGVELLIEGLALARDRSDLRLTLIGDFDTLYGALCRELVAERGVEDLVTFLDRVPRDELLAHYRSHDVFCFPTLSDTYGIAMLEAMSCGCAVLASDIGGPAELVTEETGVRIGMTNPAQYARDTADALVELAADRARCRRLGEAGRAKVIDEHNWDRILDRVMAGYEQHVLSN